MIAYNLIWVNGLTKRNTSVVSPIICRSALAIEAHRGVASLANTARYGQAMRLALRSDGWAQPTPTHPCAAPNVHNAPPPPRRQRQTPDVRSSRHQRTGDAHENPGLHHRRRPFGAAARAVAAPARH